MFPFFEVIVGRDVEIDSGEVKSLNILGGLDHTMLSGGIPHTPGSKSEVFP